MEKKNYILLFLQIAAIAVSGVLGGDTTFALITALIGITFNIHEYRVRIFIRIRVCGM
mgnify:CR=1 FL=1